VPDAEEVPDAERLRDGAASAAWREWRAARLAELIDNVVAEAAQDMLDSLDAAACLCAARDDNADAFDDCLHDARLRAWLEVLLC